MSDNLGSGPTSGMGMENPYLEESYRKRLEANYVGRIKTTSEQLRDMADAKDLANDHWGYIKALLEAHKEDPDEIHRIGFHYKSAFIHGYKHALEDLDER